MIPLLVFYAHVVFIAGLFTKRWQDEGIPEGILAVVFSGLIFFVGWSMSSFIIRLIAENGFIAGVDRDSASLLLLTAAEALFYRFYLGSERRGDATGGGKKENTTLTGAGS